MSSFSKISEHKITEAIAKDFFQKLLNHIRVDIAVVGGGPSGLVAAAELAKEGFKTLVIEANNYLGGGFWIGGYLMNTVTVREPGQAVLDEIGAPYKEAEKGLFVTDGPHACSKLIAYACDQGVEIINMTKVDDVVLREGNRVAGIVINWTPVSALPRAITCVDPVAIEAKLVIDATGHDAVVASALARRNIIKLNNFGAMWVEKSEDAVVEYTKEIHPGLIACGMSTATVFGLPRMGPTFAAMLLSGKKAAEIAKSKLLVIQPV